MAEEFFKKAMPSGVPAAGVSAEQVATSQGVYSFSCASCYLL